MVGVGVGVGTTVGVGGTTTGVDIHLFPSRFSLK